MTLWHASTELRLTTAGTAAAAAKSLRLAAGRVEGTSELGLGLGYADTSG